MNLDLMAYILEIIYQIKLKKEHAGTHWVSLFVKPKYTTESSSSERTIYFDSFGVERIPKEINKFIGNKKIKASIFRIQAYD